MVTFSRESRSRKNTGEIMLMCKEESLRKEISRIQINMYARKVAMRRKPWFEEKCIKSSCGSPFTRTLALALERETSRYHVMNRIAICR